MDSAERSGWAVCDAGARVSVGLVGAGVLVEVALSLGNSVGGTGVGPAVAAGSGVAEGGRDATVGSVTGAAGAADGAVDSMLPQAASRDATKSGKALQRTSIVELPSYLFYPVEIHGEFLQWTPSGRPASPGLEKRLHPV
jgi:hypothetical protein